ncbi:MAG TPA: LptA/OstA family protein [Chthoniobacterales bacterium]|nr:LptA/OstA family protein [Chthoniobacterales bacterium]
MSRPVVVLCIAVWALPFCLVGQTASPSPSTAAKKEKKEKSSPKPSPDKSGSLLGPANSQSNEPITTEIYADDAFFDSNKSIGIFSGHVKVADPRFTLQGEKLTVYITKGQNQGLEKAVAEGNVAVVRDRPDPNGGPPTRAVGLSDQATYIATTGDVELRGSPRVQEGVNTHIATSPDTVMVVNQKGQLTTHGPSRTEIRQEPKTDDQKGDQKDENKDEKKGEKKSETKPATSPKTSATP